MRSHRVITCNRAGCKRTGGDCSGTQLQVLHAPTIKRLGISWDYQRAMSSVELNQKNLGDFDTEVGFGLLLRQAGVLPKIVGHDVNRERQADENIDHVRSHASKQTSRPAISRRVLRVDVGRNERCSVSMGTLARGR